MHPNTAHSTNPTTDHQPDTASVRDLRARFQFACLWISTMLLVAFIDIFAFYRADVREAIDSGRVFVFDISDGFFIGIVLYVGIPTLMIAVNALATRRLARLTNLIVAPLFALTILGAAFGEPPYYWIATILELVLLGAIVTLATRAPRHSK